MNAKDNEKQLRPAIAGLVLLSISIYLRAFGIPLPNALDLLVVVFISMVLLGMGIWAGSSPERFSFQNRL